MLCDLFIVWVGEEAGERGGERERREGRLALKHHK